MGWDNDPYFGKSKHGIGANFNPEGGRAKVPKSGPGREPLFSVWGPARSSEKKI